MGTAIWKFAVDNNMMNQFFKYQFGYAGTNYFGTSTFQLSALNVMSFFKKNFFII